MTERPILFSGPMVRAIRDGRKTMTRRRLLRPTNRFHASYIVPRVEDGAIIWSDGQGGMERHEKMKCHPGDRLWVREAWQALPEYDDFPPRYIPHGSDIIHLADREHCRWDSRYRHSQFMPRWASRLTLIVTDVRVERVQDISEEDAQAEGCCPDGNSLNPNYIGPARSIFESLWTSINGPGSWEDNPWVAAITFRPVFANIDSPEAATATSDH